MANTLTGLIPVMYQGLDIVSRELVGLIPSVSINASADMVAKDEVVTIPIAPASTAADVTPGLYAPDDGNQTIGNVTMTIDKSRRVPIRWNGEEQLGYRNNGQYEKTLAQQFAQACRTLCGEIETDLANLYVSASRAYGTASTVPFASTLADPAQMRKILSDNGAPLEDRQLVIDTSAGAALRSLAQLTKVNEAGTDDILRRGVLIDLHGFAIRESSKITYPAIGGGSLYVVNHAAYPVGTTSIVLGTGTGTILAGDVVTFATDTANKYVVTTGIAAAGTLVIAAPGLRKALPDTTALSIVAISAKNMAFHRSAIQLLARVPAMPVDSAGNNIDMADDMTVITDPVSGLSFQVVVYKQYRQLKYEVCMAWGVKCIKPEHTAILLGGLA